MIFAAGFGTRMGALTRTRPKPLIPVAGRALIDHTLDLIRDQGVPNVVANAHYLPDQIESHLGPLGVVVSTEAPDILDTGGGLKHALPLLGEGPVFTTNSDAIWQGLNPLRLLAGAWDPARMDALLICVPLAGCLGRKGAGDFALAEDGRISRGGDHVYGGVQILNPARVSAHPGTVFSLNAVWDDIARDGRLFGLGYPGHWCDVGHPDGIALAETLISEPHV
jgi:MurNAc alpha-1-phosphate uridylyltransferase